MHLRAITLAGFKTFARQTEVRFEGGITAIVGPNGSGKTNILDAFRWVLGESSARDLRGRKMEEVIYAGGERRHKAAVAEVEVVIDNSSRRLPLDYEEVAIRRRVDRSGQSDYFLNGSRVRRRDILEVLASTGLTTDSYSMVTQRDIESIISCTAEQRRVLVEEAAQVRGVKAKRSEAADRLRELAINLERLEDLRGEIGPRLELLGTQAAAAREAAAAEARLALLRGSIVFEEWREARDQHRRLVSQSQGLQRRLEEARSVATTAEAAFQDWRRQVQAAQDRRLQRQRLVGAIRLELSAAEHQLAMAEERAHNQAALASAARSEVADLEERQVALAARRAELEAAAAEIESGLGGVPAPPPAPERTDADRALAARAAAEEARRQLAAVESAAAAAASRCQLLEETVARLRSQVEPAEAALAGLEAELTAATAGARAAADAAAELARARAELAGLEALRPAPRGDLRRVGDVVLARPGYEAALSSVLGPLVDSWAAPDAATADTAARSARDQATVLWPAAGADVEPGSLLEHVRCEAGYEDLARRLLGRVVLGRDVTEDGVFRAPGLMRAGADARVRLSARRRELLDLVAELEPVAGPAAGLADRARSAERAVAEARAAAGGRQRLAEAMSQYEVAVEMAADAVAGVPRARAAHAEADSVATSLARSVEDHRAAMAAHEAEVRRLETERARWRERAADVARQLRGLEADGAAMLSARQARLQRVETAEAQAQAVRDSLPALSESVAAGRERLAGAERELPDEEAEHAASARRLVELEEARIEARLKATTLEGNLELASREADLLAERMDQIRARMPEGLAPEEIPGGKAREREMRDLERLLRDLGPTNPLAASEHAELVERSGVMEAQLADIAAARADLEQLIERLRGEEESRYDTVFQAVAATFDEYFAELTGGGRGVLRHVAGAEGPRSGVEIAVQPVRKRMQDVNLLSSGERSLVALALVLALAEVNPAPFTILDEVDAALDDANVGRFGEMLQRLGKQRQFLVITHNHMTMASASSLYGVHLDESGCSHLVSVRLDDIRPVAPRAAAKPAVLA